MKDRDYLTAVYAFNYFGPARVKLLLSYFKTAKKIWFSKTQELIEVGLPKGKVNDFEKFRKNFDLVNYFKKLKKLGIAVVTIFDTEYPKNLKDIEGAPIVLYFKGKLKARDKNLVAIVGSRKMTSYGKLVTERFSSELVGYGVTIVSGLARGIDTAAHEATIKAGGRTIAVLGSGLDRVYPPENLDLALRIVKSRGALISEYPLGYPPLPENFPARNRIVSGISEVVLVIEGEQKSGTLLTASHAAEQGKTVLAVPGQITSPMSGAPHFLIKNGAKIAENTKDILDELHR